MVTALQRLQKGHKRAHKPLLDYLQFVYSEEAKSQTAIGSVGDAVGLP